MAERGGAPATDDALAAALCGHRVLLAYGLMGELMSRLAPVGLDYMGAQLAWLRRAICAEAQVVPLPTGAPVARNAARLAAVLAGDERPALVIGHSKGGLEALAALLQPEAAARCRAFLALQSPFYGSPVADALVEARLLHRAAGMALEALRLGTGEGLQDLTTAARRAWMERHAAGVASLVAQRPVLTVATWHDPSAPEDRAYAPLVRWVERRGGRNDGLVTVQSALLPGARHVVLPGVHRTLVAASRNRDPVVHLRALIAQLIGAG